MKELYHANVGMYVSPLYYHDVSVQLKTVIDRYHGIDNLLRGTDKKVLSMITGAYSEELVFDGIKATLKATIRCLGRKDCGGIYTYNCQQVDDIPKTDYPRQAFELGLKLSEVVAL